MTREDIIRTAKDAGFVDYELDDGTTESFDKRYERFATLVASAEREEIIKITKDLYYWDDSESLIKAIQARGSDAEKN